MSRKAVNGKAKTQSSSEAERHMNLLAKWAIPVAITAEEMSEIFEDNLQKKDNNYINAYTVVCSKINRLKVILCWIF